MTAFAKKIVLSTCLQKILLFYNSKKGGEIMGKGRIRVEERIKAETDAEMQKATLLDQTQTKKK
jgi:hypothetical protein